MKRKTRNLLDIVFQLIKSCMQIFFQRTTDGLYLPTDVPGVSNTGINLD